VQLIDATGFSRKMRKSLGQKRNEIADGQIAAIVQLYGELAEGPHCKTFANTDFGYRRITVERPLRLRYHLTEAALATILADRSVRKLLQPDIPAGQQAFADPGAALVAALRAVAGTPTVDEAALSRALDAALAPSGLKLPAPAKKAILAALGERDESAPPARGPKGELLPDPELRDNEDVPLSERVEDYFAREVTPHVPDAWISARETDPRDGQVGKVGYEINFNRYFYHYQPPRPLAEIDAELRVLEQEIADLLREVTA
jgi:type I restriction enzyme M protein